MGIASNLGRIALATGGTGSIGAVSASRSSLEKAGWSLAQLDLIEANESFAAQALAEGQGLDWDAGKVNVNSGAIARGHPVDASGCRILVSLLHEMLRRDVKKVWLPCVSAAATAWRWPSSAE